MQTSSSNLHTILMLLHIFLVKSSLAIKSTQFYWFISPNDISSTFWSSNLAKETRWFDCRRIGLGYMFWRWMVNQQVRLHDTPCPTFPGPSKIPRRLTLQKVGFYRGGFTIGSPYGSPYGEPGILQRILGTHKTCKGRHSNGVEGAVLLGFALQKVVKNGKNYSQRSWKHSLIASTFCKLKLMVWLGV